MVYIFYQTIARPYKQIQSSANWHKVTARITKFETYDGNVDLEYYFINGVDTIRGNELFFGSKSGIDDEFIYELEQVFKGASRVNVFVNPKNQQENVIIRDLASIKEPLISILFITIVEFFIYMLFFGFNLKSDHSEIAEKIVVLLECDKKDIH